MNLVGELTADGKTVILIANGPDPVLLHYAKLLQTLTPLIQQTDPPGALRMPLSWPGVVQLAALFGDRWTPGERLAAWVSREIAARTGRPGSLVRNPPEGLTPRPYQTEGAAMIGATGRMLLTDEQGTGKTITTILGLVERADLGHPTLPVVCVVPNSVVDNWVDEWRKWAPHWRAVAWQGAPVRRRTLAGTADVYVASYETAGRDAGDRDGPLVKLRAESAVVDECHLIKSPNTMRSMAARRLARAASNRLMLSGTPITHHPGDLWAALEGLEPFAWPAKERWVGRYCLQVPGDYGTQVLGLIPERETEFRTTLTGAFRRVAKADVLAHLPPKVYTERVVDLPREWRLAYDTMESEMLAELPDSDEELSVMSVLTKLTRLSQMAAAPVDVTRSVTVDDDGEEHEHVHVRLKAPSWKVAELMTVLEERPGQPVVAFAPSRQLMMLAGRAAEDKGLQVGYVVGRQRRSDRTDTVAAFQAGKLDLLCATTGAGGVGLTLTAAGTLVDLQRPMSIVDSSQMEDRCHRIGSERHRSIEIIDIVARNSIDQRIREILWAKAGQLSALLRDPRIVATLLGGRKPKKGARK